MSPPASATIATAHSPAIGTPLPSAHASSARVVTPGSTGVSGTPLASARAEAARMMRSASR